MPGRDRVLLLLTTAVIVTTLVVQGFTLGPLVRRSGIAVPAEDTRTEDAAALLAMSCRALAHLDQVEEIEAAPPVVVAQLRQALRSRHDDGDGTGEDATGPALRQLRRYLIAVEAAELTRLYREGAIGAAVRRQLQRRLDLEEASLGD